MKITKEPFGNVSGGSVVRYTMEAGKCSASVLNYGGILQSLIIPDKDGKLRDIVLGFDSAAPYETDGCHLGSTVGRHANRLKGPGFTLNGIFYPLALNNGANHLHGGNVGFDRHFWEVEPLENGLRLSRLSPDGEEGYPGNLKVSVTYSLSEDGALSILYEAVSDADTVVNLTNHSYFNLNGHDSGSALGHRLWIDSDAVTENDSGSLPTGKILPVDGTPFDFQKEKTVGRDIHEEDEQLAFGHGYDLNYILNGSGMRLFARLTGEKSGIVMEAFTDQPGVQLYNACYTDIPEGKGGARYEPYSAVCLETQHFPNAMEIREFPSVVLRAGEQYRSETVYKFSV